MKRAWMDRFIDTIEWIAAGFVGLVALNIFISVLLRNTLNYSIPDSFDIGRMLLGILIFWGIAATSYRGNHITVDLLYANVGPRLQRIIDVFAGGSQHDRIEWGMLGPAELAIVMFRADVGDIELAKAPARVAQQHQREQRNEPDDGDGVGAQQGTYSVALIWGSCISSGWKIRR